MTATKTQHSPGPWALKEANATIPIVDADGRTVASVRYGDRDYSDARLIAAAPDLLSALNFVRKFTLLRPEGLPPQLKAAVLEAIATATA